MSSVRREIRGAKRYKKRIVFCFDGTWNRLDSACPTNVVIVAESVTPIARDGKTQIVYYDQGVGTGRMERFRGGVFGMGLLDNLEQAYRFLTFNFEPGDEIFVFGFSRGAYTARSFAGLLSNCAIPLRAHAGQISDLVKMYKSNRKNELEYQKNMRECRKAVSPNLCVSDDELRWRRTDPNTSEEQVVLRMAYLGVWDTVGALGIPQSFEWLHWANRKYRFHDTELSGFVISARHAVAIDEVRRDFVPTLWTNLREMNEGWQSRGQFDEEPYQQKWFPGNHGSVGGGGERRGLSDQALDWVLDGARKMGLDLDHGPHSRIFELRPSFSEHIENSSNNGLVYNIMKRIAAAPRTPGPQDIAEVSFSAVRRWKANKADLKDGVRYRPVPLLALKSQLDEMRLPSNPELETKGEFTLYQVERGDTLQKVATKFLGSATRWPEVFAINRDKIEQADRIYVGQVLKVPII